MSDKKQQVEGVQPFGTVVKDFHIQDNQPKAKGTATPAGTAARPASPAVTPARPANDTVGQRRDVRHHPQGCRRGGGH